MRSNPNRPHTMTKELFDQIIENPADMDSRLVYADWLTENGEPRGQLIHVQYELTQSPSPKRQRLLNLKEKGLLRLVSAKDEVPDQLRDPKYRNGFIEGGRIFLADYLEKGEELCKKFPLRSLRLQIHDDEKLREIKSCPAFKNIEEIEYWPYDHSVENSHLRLIANCPHLSNLKSLHFIGHVDFTLSGVKALANSEFTTDFISFVSKKWDDACTKVICESSNFRNLQRLSIGGGTKSCVHLPDSEFRNKLRELSLGYIGDKGVESLFRSEKPFEQLRTLRLSDCNLSTEAVRILTTQSHLLPNLKELAVDQNSIKDKGAELLAESPFLSQLDVVNLQNCGLKLPGVLALAESATRNKETRIELSGNKIPGEEKAELISRHPEFEQTFRE